MVGSWTLRRRTRRMRCCWASTRCGIGSWSITCWQTSWGDAWRSKFLRRGTRLHEPTPHSLPSPFPQPSTLFASLATVPFAGLCRLLCRRFARSVRADTLPFSTWPEEVWVWLPRKGRRSSPCRVVAESILVLFSCHFLCFPKALMRRY